MLTAVAEGKTSSSAKEEGDASVWIVLDLAPKKRGSMEEQLLALARRCHDRRVPLTYVFSREPYGWLAARLAELDTAVRTLDFRHVVQKTATFARWLLAARPSLVHFHFVRAHSPLVLAARAAGARVVVTDHMTLRSHARGAGGLLRDAIKWLRAEVLHDLPHRRIAVSRFVAESVRAVEHVPPARQLVIEHGIDVDRFAAADGQSGKSLRDELRAGTRPLVACVARLDEDKGVGTLLEAHARIGRDALLVFAGEGPMRARLESRAVELGLASHVRLLGLRNDVERVYAAADVVVCPSHGVTHPEAFGLAVVEAMAAGRPLVVTESGAMPALVQHGKLGLVVPPKDPVALAGAVGRLIDDRVLAERLSQAARAVARERYGMEPWVDATVAVYRDVAPALGRLA
jgi:glycosyltransferase involved in cell wall biosynthesis